MRSRLLLAAFVALLPLSAGATVDEFRGDLSFFIGDGAGNLSGGPFSTGLAQQGPSLGHGLGSFTIPASAFGGTVHAPIATLAGGPVPIPASGMNALFGWDQTLTVSNEAGVFGPGLGPAGGFGGTLRLAGSLNRRFGIEGITTTAVGSVAPYLAAGSPGTAMGLAGIFGNNLTVTAVGTGWTTGVITYGGTPGFKTQGTVSGWMTAHRYSAVTTAVAYVRQMSLVTPVVFRANLGVAQSAGYAVLRLRVLHVPEPSVGLLVAGAGVCLAGVGRFRTAKRA